MRFSAEDLKKMVKDAMDEFLNDAFVVEDDNLPETGEAPDPTPKAEPLEDPEPVKVPAPKAPINPIVNDKGPVPGKKIKFKDLPEKKKKLISEIINRRG